MSVRMLSAVIDMILMKSGLNNKKYAISHSKDSGGRALLELVNLVVQESRALTLLVFLLRLVSKSHIGAASHFGFTFLSCLKSHR